MRKRVLAFLGFLLSAVSCFAQSPTLFSWQDTIQNTIGQANPNVTIIVLSGTVGGAQAVNTTTQPGTPLATIYADPYGTTLINQATNPVTTSAGNGQFQFWAPSGYYVIQAYGPGINGQLVYGIALGGAGGGSGTVNLGNQGQIGCYLSTGTAISGAGTVTAGGQLLSAAGTSQCPQWVNFGDVKVVPAANCEAGNPGGGWSSASSNFTAACRAGSNNLGGAMQCVPSSGCSAQFMVELPADWAPNVEPLFTLFYGSGANTSGTVIWTVSSACTGGSPGAQTDDPSFLPETALAASTMAAANRMWRASGGFTYITTANNCLPQSSLLIKVAVSGTAASNINAYQMILTIPRRPQVQSN